MNGEIERSRFKNSHAPTPAHAAQIQQPHPSKTKSFKGSLKLPKVPAKNTYLKVLAWLLIIGIVLVVWRWPAKNTIPSSVRNQLHFKAIFPTKNYDPASFNYQPATNLLSYNAHQNGVKVTVTEEALPPNIGRSSTDPSVLLNQLGVHYYTQTQSKYGVVTIAKFWTKAFQPNGQTAILGAKGTLVLAHPDRDLSLAQWTQFFNSLGI